MVSFQQDFLQNPSWISPPLICATCSTHLNLIALITQIISAVQYKSLSSTLCYFLHLPVTSSNLDPNVFLSTPYSNTHSPFCSLNVTEQVPCPQQQQPKYDNHSVHKYLDIHECCTLWSRRQSQCTPSHQRLEEDCYRFWICVWYRYYTMLNRHSSLTTLTCINKDMQ